MSPSPVPADMTGLKKSFASLGSSAKAKYNITYDKVKARKLLEGEGTSLMPKASTKKTDSHCPSNFMFLQTGPTGLALRKLSPKCSKI